MPQESILWKTIIIGRVGFIQCGLYRIQHLVAGFRIDHLIKRRRFVIDLIISTEVFVVEGPHFAGNGPGMIEVIERHRP